MHRTGTANLPLHYGKAPEWLTARMEKLAREIASIMISEYGSNVFLERISDPFWFQAFGCVLGYDWHSSGVTTVVTGVLKNALSLEEHGLAVCGGKGKTSRQTPYQIVEVAEKLSFSSERTKALQYASKMSAKVDNTAVQAGYQLYHHAFLIAENGKWAVVQQGKCPEDRTARRYHWFSDRVESFVVEPHSAIVGEAKHNSVLDMTAKQSESCRKVSVDIAKERPERIMRMVIPVREKQQEALEQWIRVSVNRQTPALKMPCNINWKTLKAVYEFQPTNYEELLAFKGVGPATVKGLALIAELVYGEKPSWKDPAKYSFAYGGKDGVPYPVNRRAMDESIGILRRAVEQARIGDKYKLKSLERLRKFIPPNEPRTIFAHHFQDENERRTAELT